MSTNFYMSVDGNEETVHLGKRNGGYAFLFKGDPIAHVNDLRSWYIRAKKLEDKGWKLLNDNGDDAKTLKELLVIIKGLVHLKQNTSGYFDENGNSFYDGDFS